MSKYLDDEDESQTIPDENSVDSSVDESSGKGGGISSVFPGLSMSDLLKRSDEANRNKKILTTAGSILQGFQNVPSAYELLSGNRVQKQDIAGGMNQLASNIQDPWERQKKTYEMYKGAQDANQIGEMNDPSSDTSKAYQENLKANFPDMAEKLGDNLYKISAAQMPAYLKPVEMKAKMDATKEIADSRIQAAQMAGQDRADAKKTAADTKASDKQNQNFMNTTQLLEQMRGAPGAAQAEKDLYAADKAKTLMEKFNNPNPQMTKLLVSEIGKIASGGQSSQHELDALTPSTLSSSLASAWQKISNEPTPANAKAFLKDYMTYANGITKDAQKTIQDRYGRIIESRKSLVSPDHYRALQDQYVNRFKLPDQKEAPQFPKTVTNGTHQATVNNQQELEEAMKEGFQ